MGCSDEFPSPSSQLALAKPDHSIFRHNTRGRGIGNNSHFTSCCCPWLPSLTRQGAKPLAKGHRQEMDGLNLEGNVQQHDVGIKFLSTPQETAQGGDRREGWSFSNRQLFDTRSRQDL